MGARASKERLGKYLAAKANLLGELSVQDIAKELLVDVGEVYAHLANQTLKSCRVEDVAEYIIKKDEDHGKN